MTLLTTEARSTYVIGDVHGCYEQLMRLEDKVHRHARGLGRDAFIVMTGDLVDRGPDSARVVRRIREGAAAGTHAAVAGNHEALLLEVVHAFAPQHMPTDLPLWQEDAATRHSRGQGICRDLGREDYLHFRRCIWLGQGGHQTLESFGCDPARPETWTVDADDLAFMAGLPLVWQDDRVVVTHGFTTPLALETWLEDELPLIVRRQAVQTLLLRRDPPKEPPSPGRIHVSGHTVVGRAQRFPKTSAVRVDTGCVFGARLTAWCAASDDFISVPGWKS